MKPNAYGKIRTEFEKLSPKDQRELLAELTAIANSNANPVTELANYVQKTFGGNMTTEIWTEGASHLPTVYCKLVLPNGVEYTASGKNQKMAKNLAAEQALHDLQKEAKVADDAKAE